MTGLSFGSSEKFSPVIVTSVPPTAEPCLGETLVTNDSVVIYRFWSFRRPCEDENRMTVYTPLGAPLKLIVTVFESASMLRTYSGQAV